MSSNDIEIICHNDKSTIPASVTKPTIHFIKGGAGGVEVIDGLTSTSTTAALSANQGRVLNNKIDAAIQAAIYDAWNGSY